ncbi:MAG TPA: fibronectin type III domain-containing protein [Polyangia bacterium]
MKKANPRHRRAKISYAPLALTLAAASAWLAVDAQAAGIPLTQSDVVLAVYASEGTSWRQLTASALAGYFGAHRCSCPVKLSAQLQLTSAGQTNLGNSTVSVNLLLGANCLYSPTSCVSLGQVSFSAAQAASLPPFDSSLVFQAAAGSTTATCAGLTAGSTTLWAVLTQDGVALSFTPAISLAVITTSVAAPTGVTALTADKGILVTWTAPADTSLVAGYQVLCLPRPAVPSTVGYESCGLNTTSTGADIMTPADATEICSDALPATKTSAHLTGLVNGTPYTVAVIAIDPSGGVSALSPQAVATPGPTMGFYEKYKADGGAATGCSLSPKPHAHRSGLLWIALAAALLGLPTRRPRRDHCPKTAGLTRAVVIVLAFSTNARAQDMAEKSNFDWAANPTASGSVSPPDWGIEVGMSPYRPNVDSEFKNGAHPYADIFGSSIHLMSEVELDRYLGHGFGSWGVGLRVGYYKVTGAAFQSDGVSPSGDETSLRLIPFALSALYRADGLPGLRHVPLVPYLKVGLDSVAWTETSTGESASHTGFTPGWHIAVGMALGLHFLGLGAVKAGEVAGPCSLFFEWNYAAINGLGMSHALHVGDNTWFAGLMFDL